MVSKSEAESLEILTYLARVPHPKRGVREIAEVTGIPYTEVYRYVNAEAWERFSSDEIASLRRYRPAMYVKLVGTARIDDAGRVLLNRSKLPILRNYAHKNGYDILPSKRFPFFRVQKIRNDGLFWNMIDAGADATTRDHDRVSRTLS